MGSNKTEMMNCLLEFSYHSSLLNVISPSLWHTDSNKNMAWRSPADKTRWASEYFWFTRWWGTAVSSCCFFHILNSITWMMVVTFFFCFFWIYLISLRYLSDWKTFLYLTWTHYCLKSIYANNVLCCIF